MYVEIDCKKNKNILLNKKNYKLKKGIQKD